MGRFKGILHIKCRTQVGHYSIQALTKTMSFAAEPLRHKTENLLMFCIAVRRLLGLCGELCFGRAMKTYKLFFTFCIARCLWFLGITHVTWNVLPQRSEPNLIRNGCRMNNTRLTKGETGGEEQKRSFDFAANCMSHRRYLVFT